MKEKEKVAKELAQEKATQEQSAKELAQEKAAQAESSYNLLIGISIAGVLIGIIVGIAMGVRTRKAAKAQSNVTKRNNNE